MFANIAKRKVTMGRKKDKIKTSLKNKEDNTSNLEPVTPAPAPAPASTSPSSGVSWASIAAKPPSPEVNKVKTSPPLKSSVSTNVVSSIENQVIGNASTDISKNVVEAPVPKKENPKPKPTPPPPPPPPPPPQEYDIRHPQWLRINGIDYRDPSKAPKRVMDPSAIPVNIKEVQKRENHIDHVKKGLFEITPLKDCVYTTLFENDEKNRDIKIFRLDECISCGTFDSYPNIVFKKRKETYYPLQDKNIRSTFKNVYEENHMMLDYKQKVQLKRKVNESVFYFIYNTQNLFCFLYDAVPYLISYMKLKSNFPTLKLLMQYCDTENKTFQPFVWPILNLLGIKKTDVKMLDGETRYRKIYISSSYTHDEGYHDVPRKEIYSFYKKISDAAAEKIKSDIPTLPKKIYASTHKNMQEKFEKMSRQPENYARRYFTNEKEFIEEYTVKNKFKEVFQDSSEYTILQKIVMFSRAESVIGQLGENLALALFCPKTTKLILIVTPVYLFTFPRLRYCYNHTNHKYFTKTEQIEETTFKLYMKVQSKTEIDNIVATVTTTNNTTDRISIEYTDVEGNFKQENVDSDNYIKIDEGVDSPWKINIDALKALKF